MKIAPIFAAFSLMLVCLTSADAQQCPDGYIQPSPTLKSAYRQSAAVIRLRRQEN